MKSIFVSAIASVLGIGFLLASGSLPGGDTRSLALGGEGEACKNTQATNCGTTDATKPACTATVKRCAGNATGTCTSAHQPKCAAGNCNPLQAQLCN